MIILFMKQFSNNWSKFIIFPFAYIIQILSLIFDKIDRTRKQTLGYVIVAKKNYGNQYAKKTEIKFYESKFAETISDFSDSTNLLLKLFYKLSITQSRTRIFNKYIKPTKIQYINKFVISIFELPIKIGRIMWQKEEIGGVIFFNIFCKGFFNKKGEQYTDYVSAGNMSIKKTVFDMIGEFKEYPKLCL